MAIFKSKVKVELELLNEEDMRIRFSSKSLNDLIIAKSRLPKEERGGEARELLAASLAECTCSVLLFLLKWAKIDFKNFHSTAEVITEKDETGRLYVGSINLNIHFDAPKDEETLKRIERVKRLFNRGCLISRSLEKGIKTNWTIEA